MYCLCLEAGNKVVEKVQPGEAVGVVVRIDNKIQVILHHKVVVKWLPRYITRFRLYCIIII